MSMEQFKTLYALSTLKLPLAPTAAGMLGITDNQVRCRLKHLEDKGFIERKAYGQGRVMFFPSLAGRAALDEWLRHNEPPELRRNVRPGGSSRPHGAANQPKEDQEPKEVDPLVALPRGHHSSKPYEPPRDAYYRNNGNKHIRSRGQAC